MELIDLTGVEFGIPESWEPLSAGEKLTEVNCPDGYPCGSVTLGVLWQATSAVLEVVYAITTGEVLLEKCCVEVEVIPAIIPFREFK